MNLGYHFRLIREAMLFMKEENGMDQFSADAIDLALLGNGYIDLVQPIEAEYLMDDIFCRLARTVSENCHFDRMCGSQFTQAYTQRLLINTFAAAKKACLANKPLTFMLALGTALHILQDFYGHTNWAELEMDRFMAGRDPTYYDLMVVGQRPLDNAIEKNNARQLQRFEGDIAASRLYGLFSHGTRRGPAPLPDHDKLRKDYAGQPHFEWAYRATFKATLQHLLMVKNYILTLPGGSAFWTSLASFKMPFAISGYVKRATSFDEGTIRWMSTYGGAWTWVQRWSDTDAFSDWLPGTLGIGLFEQSSWPVLGTEWLGAALDIADNLFQVDYYNSPEGLTCFSKQKFLDTARKFFSSQGGVDTISVAADPLESINTLINPEWLETSLMAVTFQAESYYKLPYSNPPTLSSTEQLLFQNALESLKTPLLTSYENYLHWVEIKVPYADDLDTGAGDWNVNNEEIGGTSDYWPMIFIDGEKYSEAEHVDSSHPVTYWQALKPCLSPRILKIKIALYESDPTDHTDEEMDVSYGDQKHFSFAINSLSGEVSDIDGNVEMLALPTGTFLRTKGSGDYRAMLRVLAGRMSDRRVEFSLRLTSNEGADRNNRSNMWAICAGRGWKLNRPDWHESSLKYYHFTYEVEKSFTPDRLASLRFSLGELSEERRMRWGYVRMESVGLGGTHYGLYDARSNLKPLGTVLPVGSEIENLITAAQSEQPVKELTAITFTGHGNGECTEAPVHISFYTDQNNTETLVGKYRLIHFDGKPFKRGCADYFWLGKQKLGAFNAQDDFRAGSKGKIKTIRRVTVEKEPGDDLHLDCLEVYANGYMIGCVDQPFSLTNSNLSRTLEITYPKLVIFKQLPVVTCKGIADIPGKPGTKGIKYEINGLVEMSGYDKLPTVTLDTKPATFGMTSKCSPTVSFARISTTIYINWKTNRQFRYDWTVSVMADNTTQIATASFEIPHPSVEILEDSFSGGNQVVVSGNKKKLQYEGSYHFNFDHFGINQRDQMAWQSILEPSFGNQPDIEHLKFTMPVEDQEQPPQPYRDNYRLLFQIKDRSDAWREENRHAITIPTLDVRVLVYYQGELYRYFSDSNRISKVSPESPTYSDYVGNQETVRSDYRIVEIYLVPCLSRKGELFSYTVFEPKFEWSIPTSVNAFNLPDLIKDQPESAAQIYSKMIRARDIDLSLPDRTFMRREPLKGARIAVYLGSGISEVGIPVKCLVTDAIGQSKLVSIPVSNHMGLSLADIFRMRVAEMMTAATSRYADHVQIKEIVKNGLRLPVMVIDRTELAKLPVREQRVVNDANAIAQFYEQNAAVINQNVAIQQQLDTRLNTLLTQLPKVYTSKSRRFARE